jgi:hypothetical protein
VVFLWGKMMIQSTECYECYGISYEVRKYEPESEIDIQDQETETEEFEERKSAITNNLAIAINSCQSVKFHVSCLGNPNDIPEEQRIEIIKRSIQTAINTIQSLKGILDF